MMGGYNATIEALSFGKPTLIVPRVRPRLEQWIRAERLRVLGLVDVLHPDELSPDRLSRWLASAARDRRGMSSIWTGCVASWSSSSHARASSQEPTPHEDVPPARTHRVRDEE
jgi:hypothetical protein